MASEWRDKYTRNAFLWGAQHANPPEGRLEAGLKVALVVSHIPSLAGAIRSLGLDPVDDAADLAELEASDTDPNEWVTRFKVAGE